MLHDNPFNPIVDINLSGRICWLKALLHSGLHWQWKNGLVWEVILVTCFHNYSLHKIKGDFLILKIHCHTVLLFILLLFALLTNVSIWCCWWLKVKVDNFLCCHKGKQSGSCPTHFLLVLRLNDYDFVTDNCFLRESVRKNVWTNGCS